MNVKEIKSYDELIEEIETAEREANAAVEPWQEELSIGDYFIRLYELMGSILPIFCAIEPFKYEEDKMRYAMTPMHRMVHAFSSVCSEGEWGDMHVAVAWKQISKEMFEQARDFGWSGEVIRM